jgi:hypothetical protein
LPRSPIISAAGALVAALIVGVPAPACAQYATDQPLRGSISPQGAAAPAGAPSGAGASSATPAATDAGQEQTPTGTKPRADTDTEAGPPALGGLGDEAPGAPETSINEVGNEQPAEPEVPELGISTENGESSQQLPGTRDLSRHRALPPPRHDLDPYVPIGMKLGSFLLFSEAEIGTILTDNVLDTKIDARSDAAFEFVPDVRLESNWGRHFFMAEFSGDRSWYKNFPVMDDRIYQAILRGRLDVTRRTHLGLEAEKSQTQSGRDSISLTDIAGQQTDLIEQHVTAAADHTFNRLTLKLSGTIADYNYENTETSILDPNDPTQTNFIPFKDIRDYREDELKLRSSYQLKPETAVFFEGEVNDRNYREPLNSAGFRRGSSGVVLLTGVTLDLPGRLTGEISGGWGAQQSIDEHLSSLEGPLLNADLIWQPTPLTKLEFIARSEIDETSLTDSLGAIDRYYELSLQHAFWRYLVLGSYVSYEKANYADDPLVDQRVKEGLTAEYYFNPYASVYARYERTDFFSTQEANDFIENEVRLGVRIRH